MPDDFEPEAKAKDDFEPDFAKRLGVAPSVPSGELRGPEPLWHRLYSEGLPLVGAAGGATMGSGLGPLGTAGGGVGGYTLGRQGVRVIDEVMRRFGKWPFGTGPTATQTAKEVGKDVLTGLAMEATAVAAPAIQSGLRSLFQRMAGSEVPSAARESVLSAARKHEIPLTIGAESGSRTASALQRVPEVALLGARSMPAAREATQKGAERAVGRLVEREGGPLSTEAGGAAVQEDIARRLRTQRQRFEGKVGARQEGITGRIETEQQVLERTLQAKRQEHQAELAADQIRVHADVDRVADRLGGERGVGPRGLGQTVQQGLKATQKEARTSSAKLYDDAFAAGDPAAEVTLTTTQEVSKSLAKMEARLRGVSIPAAERTAEGLRRTSAPNLPPELTTELPAAISQAIIERYGLATSGTRTLSEAVAISQRLKAAMRRTTDDVTRRELRQLSDAVGADIQRFAETSGGAFGSKLAQANAFYRKEVGEDFGRGALLRRALGSQPGQVGKRLLSMTDGDLVARTMARLPADEAAQVRRSAFEHLVQGASKGGDVDAAALARAISKVNPETRRVLFGSAETDLTRLETSLRTVGPRREGLEASLKQTEKDLTAQTKGRVGTLKEEGRALPKEFTEHPDLSATMRLGSDKVIQSLTRGRAGNVGELPRVWRVLTPVTQQKVRQSLMQSLLDDAKVGGAFSTDRFLTAKRKVPDDVWATVLHQEPHQALREVTAVLDRIAKLDRTSANPSGTGQGLATVFEVLRGATVSAELAMSLAYGDAPSKGEIATLGSLIVGPGLVGKAMTSRWARTLFTPSGLAAIPPNQRPAAAMLRMLLTPAAQAVQGRVGAEPGATPQEAAR